MRAAFVAVIAAALATSSVEAMPAVRTYRGESRYKAVHMEPQEVPPFPNPKDDPEFYSHRYTEDYVSQGYISPRPEWAQRSFDWLGSLASKVGINMATLAKISSPYFSGRPVFEYTTTSTFKFSGFEDDDFAGVGEGKSRSYLGENGTIKFLPNLPEDSGFDYKNDKVRGVNIGNWLLFELWMDSQLSSALNNHAINAPHANPIVDEWTAGLYSDYNWAEHVLTKHFDTWITEQDFIDIKNAGLNHVRIPFPYWSFAEAKGKSAPYLTLNRFDKLIEACGWAKTHGLKVWVDLHGVPGSQNGYDNSGHAGAIHWPNNPSYYSQTQYAYTRLVTLFSQPEWQGTVTAVEAVNEPLATNSQGVKDLIQKYYPWARNEAAKPGGQGDYTSLLMVMHDAFLGLKYWEGFFSERASHRVLLDTHPYYVYGDAEKKKKDSARLREVCAKESQFTRSQGYYPTIAGEIGVNGPNGDRASDRDLAKGPVHFPSGPDYPYSVKYMAFMARNFRTQQYVYEKASGWMVWAWKNRNARDWSYQTGLQYGWIPSNLDDKPYGDDPCDGYRLQDATVSLDSTEVEIYGEEDYY
ncbi:glycoside hydrolase [Acaromyces ingoldii]|uniref:Glycoside hydrolase n=1 Tax=Acaromyces ingoldii TaxID=215250 RepID=A0A316YXZ6_9BASI|nr:glycoside hydrolase [Acaromyces ingoldii]PWN92953.1 glycoside hydrolase [Acaromyces ingoldii]